MTGYPLITLNIKVAHFALLLFFIPFHSAIASYRAEYLSDSENPIMATSHFSLTGIDYREYSETNKQLNKESNVILGVSLHLSLRKLVNAKPYTKISTHHGYVTYTGELQSGKPYSTTSRMTLLDAELGLDFNISARLNLLLGHGTSRWNRHILSRGTIPTLKEHYFWDRWIVNLEYSNTHNSYSLQLEHLTNAGLSVDLRPWGADVIHVDMPNGLEISYKWSHQFDPTWEIYIGSSIRRFERGPTTVTNNTAFAEPKNQFVQFSIGFGYSFL